MPLELDPLILKLKGDKSHYSRVLREALAEIQQVTNRMESQVKEAAAQGRVLANQAMAARNAAMREAQRITQAALTPQEVYKQNVEALNQHLREGRISQDTYNRTLNDYNSKLPQVVAAQNAAKEADREFQRQLKENVVAARKLAKEEEADRKASDAAYQRQLKENVLAARQYAREEAVVRREQAKERQQIAKAYQQREREVAQMTSRATAAYNAQVARGQAVMDATRTAGERYAATVADLRNQQQMGFISQETYNRAVSQAQREVRNANTELREYGMNMRNLGAQIAGAGAVVTATFGGMTLAAIKQAGTYEQNKVAFETFLGSASEAEATLKDLTKFAAITPFEMPEVVAAARGLMVFGEEGEQLMETLKILGNASSATNTEFWMTALVFNQIRGVGKLLMQDFRQLATRGIISMRDLADHFDVTTEKAQEMMTAGEISFEDVRAILTKLSGEGGRFENMMDRQSQTVLGLWSTIRDNVGITFREIGQVLEPYAKIIEHTIIATTQWFRELDSGTKTAVAGLLVLGTAVGGILLTLGSVLVVVGQGVIAYNALALAATYAASSQWALNAAWIAGQVALVGLALGGIAVLSYAVYNLTTDMQEYNATVEEANRLNQLLADREVEASRKTLGDINKEEDPAKKREALEAELERLNSVIEGVNYRVKAAKKEAEELAPTWMSAWQAGRKVWEVQLAELETEEEYLARLKKAREEVYKGISATDVEAGKPAGPDEKDIENAEKYIETLKEEAETFGMAKREAEIYKHAVAGVSSEILNQMLAEDRRLTALEESKKATEELEKAQKKLGDDTKSFIDNLESSLLSLAGNSDEMKLQELITRGASEADIAKARSLMEMKEASEAAKKAEQERKKQMEEGKRIMEQYLTPMEKYNKEVEDLTKLHSVGALDNKTMQRAIQAAQKELHEAEMKLRVTVDFGGNEAVRKGTQEYRQLLARVGADQALAAQGMPVKADPANPPVPPRGVPPGEPGRGDPPVPPGSEDREMVLLERIAVAVEAMAAKDGLALGAAGLGRG